MDRYLNDSRLQWKFGHSSRSVKKSLQLFLFVLTFISCACGASTGGGQHGLKARGVPATPPPFTGVVVENAAGSELTDRHGGLVIKASSS